MPKELKSELFAQRKLLVIITQNRKVKCMKLGKSPRGFCRLRSCLAKSRELFTSTNEDVNPAVLLMWPFKGPYQMLWRKVSCHGHEMVKDKSGLSLTEGQATKRFAREVDCWQDPSAGRGTANKSGDTDDIFVGDIGLFEVVQTKTSCRNLVALRSWMMKQQVRFKAEGEKQLSNAGKYRSWVRWCWWRRDLRAMADRATKIPENPLSSRK